MRKIRLIPRLDIKGENLIKSINLEGLRKIGNPNFFAKRYYEQGADELIYIDCVASLYGRNSLYDIIRKSVQDIYIPITVGGGIRTTADVEKVLNYGADKVAVNTAAVKDSNLITEIANKYGSSTVIVSIEAKKIKDSVWEVYTNNGRDKTGKDVIDWIQEVEKKGAGEILLTSVDREGTRLGFEIELYQNISSKCSIPIIASGGMGKLEDIINIVKNTEIDGVAIADMIHYERYSFNEIKKYAFQNFLNIRYE